MHFGLVNLSCLFCLESCHPVLLLSLQQNAFSGLSYCRDCFRSRENHNALFTRTAMQNVKLLVKLVSQGEIPYFQHSLFSTSSHDDPMNKNNNLFAIFICICTLNYDYYHEWKWKMIQFKWYDQYKQNFFRVVGHWTAGNHLLTRKA